ncbi:MAG: NUDIX hydrolase [Bacteroidota bacterium]
MIPEKNNWKLLDSEKGPELPLFKVRFDYQQNERNGHVIKTLVLEAADSANVVAITPEQRILMVKQYRFGTGEETVELPGGLVDPGEDHLTAVQRELREETGYTGLDWKYLGYIDSNAVFIDSFIHHYLVRSVRRTDVMQLDDSESIDLLELTIPEVRAWVQTGRIRHPHTLSALARVFPLWEPLIDHPGF